jgi:hypothetical protein
MDRCNASIVSILHQNIYTLVPNVLRPQVKRES